MLAASLLLVGGCARPRLPEAPPAPPRLTLTHQVQSKLIEDAREHLEQGRFRVAARLLRNLIGSHPDSPFHLDMRWALAQAHVAADDLPAALDEYRRIIRAARGGVSDTRNYADKAERRIALLRHKLKPVRGGSRSLNLIQISPGRLPPRADLPKWMESLRQSGITTLILEVGTESVPPPSSEHVASPDGNGQPPAPAGVYFRTNRATVIDDSIERVIPLAHRYGLAVFGAVTLRQMNWLEPSVGWADRMYDPGERRLRRSAALDLFHPGFQDYLTGLLTDLADTGIDGLVFRADAPMGPTDGFSPFALDQFGNSFGIQLDPSELFAARISRRWHGPSDYAPAFWRWTGWKARERLKIMDRLRQAMRQRAPKLEFAIEVHPEAVHRPIEALVWYSEDLLEAKHAMFDYVLVRTDKPWSTHTMTAPEPGDPNASPSEQAEAGLVTRLIAVMGDPGRVWVTTPLPTNDLATVSRDLNPQADRASFAQGIGLLYMKRVPSVP